MKRLKQFFLNFQQARIVVPILSTGAWMASIVYLSPSFLRGLFSILYLAFIPGYVLYRLIVGYPRGEIWVKVLCYAVGLSLASLMLLGLGVNQVLLAYGDMTPLTMGNLTVAIAAYTILITILTALRKRPRRLKRYAKYAKYFQLAFYKEQKRGFWFAVAASVFLVLLPLLAIGGANTLNNGGPNYLAMTVVGLCALALATLAWTNDKRFVALYPLGLYSVALALLLGTSMRGWAITGHDIMQEFQVFQLTSVHSQWNMKFYQDAYSACLSITILPTIFQRLTGMSDPYVFKFLFQAIFALIGPLLYVSLRPQVPRKFAFLVPVVFITFPTFLTDIMMLNRQEIALLFFALALTATMDRRLLRLQKEILMIIFFGGMVLAHYSTSYVTLGILIVATVLGAIIHFSRRLTKNSKMPFLRESPFTMVPPFIVVIVLAMIVGWSDLATNTAGNITQTITGVTTYVSHMVFHTALPPKAATTPVAKGSTTFEQFMSATKQTRTLVSSAYYPTSIISDFAPVQIPEASTDVTPFFKILHVPASVLNTIYGLIRQAYIGLLALLLGIGLLIMIIKRNAVSVPTQYSLLGAAALVVMVLQVVLPSSAINYGLARVIQQGLIVLSLPVALSGVWLLGRLRMKYIWRYRLVGAAFVLLFLVLSSFASTITGGYKPALAFSNSGFYYEAYYTHADEIQADQWLVANAPKGSRVYADEFARRKMITYAGIFAQPSLMPVAFPVDSYVYLSDGNMKFNEVPAYYNGNLVFYSLPTGFLNQNKNLLYNSGNVLIYK